MTTLTLLPLTAPASVPEAPARGSVRVVRPARLPADYLRPATVRSCSDHPRPATCDGSYPPELLGSRLTAQGRAAVTLVWLLLAGLAVVAIMRSNGGQVEPPPVTTTVVVERGDSLWALARDIDAAADPRSVVSTIIELNSLRSGADIHPGDVLVVPAPG